MNAPQWSQFKRNRIQNHIQGVHVSYFTAARGWLLSAKEVEQNQLAVMDNSQLWVI